MCPAGGASLRIVCAGQDNLDDIETRRSEENPR